MNLKGQLIYQLTENKKFQTFGFPTFDLSVFDPEHDAKIRSELSITVLEKKTQN